MAGPSGVRGRRFGESGGGSDPAAHPTVAAPAPAGSLVVEEGDARQVDVDVDGTLGRRCTEDVDDPGVEGVAVPGGQLLGAGLDGLRDAEAHAGDGRLVAVLVGLGVRV